MLKIRLHGKENEINKFRKIMNENENITILSESEMYKDRGKSIYKRQHLDIELIK